MTRPGVPVVVTGMGVRTAIARDVAEFETALREGRSGIGWIDAEGLRVGGALLGDQETPEISATARRVLRAAPLATRIGCAVAMEAMLASALTSVPDWKQSAIVAGGNNIHQGYMHEHYERFRSRPEFVNPRYAVSFLDTNLVGALSEIAELAGPGFTVGGSMASGNVALYQAWHLLQSGAAPACICVGALADYGELEFRAFANLGALAVASGDGAGPYAPFDRRHAGFSYGQGSGCVILETAEAAERRGARALAEVAGVSLLLDGHAASDPSPKGEASAMRQALAQAGATPADVDYLNAHGTGTPAGDEAECEAISDVFEGLPGPRINSTKALTGHTIYAAGIVELIATVLQMNGGFVHPNPGLEQPVSERLRFVGPRAEAAEIGLALSNSFSIGGINTCVAVRK
jgi:malonyl-ACP decarboxylase